MKTITLVDVGALRLCQSRFYLFYILFFWLRGTSIYSCYITSALNSDEFMKLPPHVYSLRENDLNYISGNPERELKTVFVNRVRSSFDNKGVEKLDVCETGFIMKNLYIANCIMYPHSCNCGQRLTLRYL